MSEQDRKDCCCHCCCHRGRALTDVQITALYAAVTAQNTAAWAQVKAAEPKRWWRR